MGKGEVVGGEEIGRGMRRGRRAKEGAEIEGNWQVTMKKEMICPFIFHPF